MGANNLQNKVNHPQLTDVKKVEVIDKIANSLDVKDNNVQPVNVQSINLHNIQENQIPNADLQIPKGFNSGEHHFVVEQKIVPNSNTPTDATLNNNLYLNLDLKDTSHNTTTFFNNTTSDINILSPLTTNATLNNLDTSSLSSNSTYNLAYNTHPVSPGGDELAFNIFNYGTGTSLDLNTSYGQTNYLLDENANGVNGVNGVVITPHVIETNVFIKAFSAITNLFTTEPKQQVAIVPITGGFGSGQDTSGFTSRDLTSNVPVVTKIGHQPISSDPVAMFGNESVLQDGNNNLFFVSSSFVQSVHSSDTVNTVALTASHSTKPVFFNIDPSNVVQDVSYFMVPAAHTSTPIQPGGFITTGSFFQPPIVTTYTPGALFDSAQRSTAPSTGTDFNLTLSENNSEGVLIASVTVPTAINATVTVPAAAANALLLYDITTSAGTNNPDSIYGISDYSANAFITSLAFGNNMGSFSNAFTLNASDGLALIIPGGVPSSAYIYVDSSFVVHGIGIHGTFNPLSFQPTLVQEGSYNYFNLGDAIGSGSTDMLFGSNSQDNGLLLYETNATSMPALISLANLANTPTVQTTSFVVPSNDIVGVPIAHGATPIDGGAAANALSDSNAGVNFAGNFTGNGTDSIIVEKFSADYTYDSDLAYVIYGQATNFPVTVNLLPYGNANLNNDIVGTGVDQNGNFVQNVHGFTITGPLNNGVVEPDSFSVKSIGDLTGDGYNDLLAFSNNNTAYIIFGHPDTGTNTNINLGTSSPYELTLFTLPNVATSTDVPTINDIQGGSSLDGTGLDSLLFTSAIPISALENLTIPFAKYLTEFTDANGNELGAVLSGAFLTDSSLTNAGILGSVYEYTDPNTGLLNASHIIMGSTATLTGSSGIDDLIGMNSTSQTLIEQGDGTTNPNMPGVVGSTLIGGAGNNTFEVADGAFHQVQGSSAQFEGINGTSAVAFTTNTLILDSGTLDFTNVPNPSSSNPTLAADHIVSGIGEIELGNNTTLDLGINNVNLTLVPTFAGNSQGTGNTLIIEAKNGANQNPAVAPTLNLENNGGSNQWSLHSSTGSINGISASIYVGGSTTVIVDNHVNVHVH